MKKAAWLGLLVAVFTVVVAGQWVKAQDAAPAAGGKLELAEGADQPVAAKPDTGLWQIITGSGFVGVMIWIVLMICSVASMALIVDSFMNVKHAKIMPADLIANVRSSMEQGDLLKAIQHCDSTPGPLANILKAGFAQVENGFEVVQDSVTVAADLETETLMSRVTYLSVISNTAPMVGLLGTVQGMIMAFEALGTQAAGAAQQAMLALSISQGLWTTAVGLIAAVPASIFYFFFKNRAMNIILQMEALTIDTIKSLRNVEVVAE